MFVSTITQARHEGFSKLKSNDYIYHQVLHPVAFNHGTMTYIYIYRDLHFK